MHRLHSSRPHETSFYFDKSRASSHTSQSSHNAGIAQLVERNLAKVEVASSRLVSRSNYKPTGGVAEWLCSGLQSRGRRFDSDPRLQPK